MKGKTAMHHDRMLKSTVQLFIKAFIIGVLVNIGLHYVAGKPLQADQTPLHHYEYQLLKQAPATSDLNFPDQ